MPARTAAQGSPHKHDDLFRQVADSETFQSAPTMRALLVYLWNHQGEQLSEYAIATEALGRSPDFDPKSDSTVRVHIARLRAKLKEFNEAAGPAFPLRLALPLGRHELTWTYQPQHKSLVSKLRAIPRQYLWAVALSELVLALACIALLVQNHSLRASVPVPPPPLPRFWALFLMPGKSTMIVLPSPLYFFSVPPPGICPRPPNFGFHQLEDIALPEEHGRPVGRPGAVTDLPRRDGDDRGCPAAAVPRKGRPAGAIDRVAKVPGRRFRHPEHHSAGNAANGELPEYHPGENQFCDRTGKPGMSYAIGIPSPASLPCSRKSRIPLTAVSARRSS